MDAGSKPPGRTQDFVVGRGFKSDGDRTVLVDGDGRGRLFLELTTDADHPHSEPSAAYESLLSTLEPGGQIRFLQVFWPDLGPRESFLRQTERWPEPEERFRDALRSDLAVYLATSPLPYLRRTIFEVVITGDEMWEWVEGAVEVLRMHGLAAVKLDPGEVQELARWVFNPVLE